MASYNGTDLGFIFEMPVAGAPKGRQINTYCGANGLEVIDLGTRGGRTVVVGALGGVSPSALGAVEAALRSLQSDGAAYILVDTLGNAWPGVILELFQPVGRVCVVVGGGYARKYNASFLHTI